MTTPAEPAQGPPSPFLLASGTSSAFVLLISVVFAIAALFHPHVFDLIAVPGSPSYDADYTRCVQAMFSQPGQVLNPSRQQQCAAIEHSRRQDLRPAILLCFATLAVVTFVQYWWGPAWRIRRRRLRLITGDALPELHEELQRLAAWAVPGRRVAFLLDLLNPAVDGLAFGRAGRRYIVISRGMPALFDTDRSMFRAVVLHELAHVRNRDLDITAVTLALWRSFVAVILIPGLLTTALGILLGRPPTTLGGQVAFVSGPGLSWLLGAQLLGVAALARLTRYTVLQARELHADARALAWQQDATPLRRLFEVTPKRRRSLAAWRRRTHPHLAVRRTSLLSAGPLLRQGFAFSFAVGACFSLAMDPATSLTAQVRTDPFYWPAEAFTLVLVVALGIRALRAAAFADGTDPAIDGLWARCGLAAGLPIGWALAPGRLTDQTMIATTPGIQLAGLLVLAAAGWLLALWLERVAAVWAPKVRTAEHPARAAIAPVALVVVVVLLLARTVYGLQTDDLIAHAMRKPAVADPVALVLRVAQMVLDEHFLSGVWLPACFVLLMAFPVIGLFTRPASGRHGTAAHGPLSEPVLARTSTALVAALLLAWGAVAVFQAADGYGAPAEMQTGIGATAAAVVALRSRSYRVTKGVLAAACAGVLYALLLTGHGMPWPVAMLILGRAVEAGVLAGLVVTALHQMRAWVRRARPGERRPAGAT